MLMRMCGVRDRRNVAVLLGACSIWLGFPNDLAFLPLVILLWPLSLAYIGFAAKSPAEAARFGLTLNFLGIGATLYWLAYPIHQVGDLPWPLASLVALLVALALALIYTFFPLVLYRAKNLSPVKVAFIAAVAWTLLEIVSGEPLDFPWIPLTGGLVLWPILVQVGVYVGSTGTAFLWIFLLMLLVFPRGSKKALTFGLLVLALLLFVGAKRCLDHPKDALPSGENSLGVLFVEGNFDQNEKWTPSLQRATLDRYRTLTRTGLEKAPGPVSLIIWPETCMPFFLENSPILDTLIRESARESKRPLLFGVSGEARSFVLPKRK